MTVRPKIIPLTAFERIVLQCFLVWLRPQDCASPEHRKKELALTIIDMLSFVPKKNQKRSSDLIEIDGPLGTAFIL